MALLREARLPAARRGLGATDCALRRVRRRALRCARGGRAGLGDPLRGGAAHALRRDRALRGPRRRLASQSCDAEAEDDKKRRYPDGQTPWRAVPLATETGGRHGLTALKHLRKLARKQAEKLEEGGDEAVSALVQKWGAWLSVALQRANAKVLLAALGTEAAEKECSATLREALAG